MKFDQPIDHTLQREIMNKMMSAETVRYSELKPKSVESNLFMYHLKQLIKESYIEKSADGGYGLTLKGKMYVDRSSLENMRLRVQPKIITILAIRHADGDWLIAERLHQPHLNVKGFPSGKIHFGEHIQDAAERELDEKTGLTALPLQLRGSVLMRTMAPGSDATPVNHIIGYVFSGIVQGEKTVKSSDYFRTYWGPERELTEGRHFTGNAEIIGLLAGTGLFIESFDFTAES